MMGVGGREEEVAHNIQVGESNHDGGGREGGGGGGSNQLDAAPAHLENTTPTPQIKKLNKKLK